MYIRLILLIFIFIIHPQQSIVCFAFPTTDQISPSFDCNKAKTPIELSICTDNELILYDYIMSNLYTKTRSLYVNKSEILQEQRNWIIKRESICTNSDNKKHCLVQQYMERINYLLGNYPNNIYENFLCNDIKNIISYKSITNNNIFIPLLQMIANNVFLENEISEVIYNLIEDKSFIDEELYLQFFLAGGSTCNGYKPLATELLTTLNH